MHIPNYDTLLLILNDFLDKNSDYSVNRTAIEIDVSPITMKSFLHRTRKPYRHTLLRIEKFLKLKGYDVQSK